MEELIQLNSFPIQKTISILLKDKTTKKNIIWATNSYEKFGDWYEKGKQMTVDSIMGLSPIMLQPRVLKALEQQQERTRNHAEVFTPSWICNMMNNHCDEEWFGRKDVFNVCQGHSWTAVAEKIEFPKGKDWKKYVDSRRLEITCGEAPYLVSRYDAATGEIIPVGERIGILDRKLRIVGENASDEKEWLKWAYRAFQSTYGYEYQGDNLLIGRINLLMTFVDYLDDKWHRKPTDSQLKKTANIISWNLWQMDGLTGLVPFAEPKEEFCQLSLFENFVEEKPQEETEQQCRIYDWRAEVSLFFNSLKK